MNFLWQISSKSQTKSIHENWNVLVRCRAGFKDFVVMSTKYRYTSKHLFTEGSHPPVSGAVYHSLKGITFVFWQIWGTYAGGLVGGGFFVQRNYLWFLRSFCTNSRRFFQRNVFVFEKFWFCGGNVQFKKKKCLLNSAL